MHTSYYMVLYMFGYTKYDFVSTNRLLCWLYFTLLKITLYMCQINTLH